MPSTIRERLGAYLLRKTESFAFGDVPGGGDAAMMVDQAGWNPIELGLPSVQPSDLRPLDRIQMVRRSRIYYERDAYAKQAIRLHTIYCVGRGMSIKARDYKSRDAAVINQDGTPYVDPETEALQRDADAFWEHIDNSYVLSAEAQSENSDKLNVDGELFFTLFPPAAASSADDAAFEDEALENDNVTRVSMLDDCLQITRIVKNPDNAREPWYYLRVWSENGQTKKRLYPDYRLYLRDERDGEDNLRLPDVPTGIGDLNGVEVATETFMYHMKVNTIGERGNSLLTPALDWAKVLRTYLEDRATINRAHARFAFKRIIKGPASAVASFGKRLASTQTASGVPLPSLAGSTLTVNSGVDWEQMGAQDGGKNAYSESRNFRLMFCAAVGFAEHYFADGSMGTRATSKEMERPTELMLVAYQTLWKGAYEAFFSFHLKATGRDYDAHAVWVDAPQILEDDTASVVTSLLAVIGVLPQFDIDEMLIRMLNAFGIDDPQDVLVKIRQRQAELYQQNLTLAFAQAGLDPAALDGIDLTDPAELTKLVTAQQQIITMVTAPSDPTRQPGPKVGPQFGQPGTKGGALVQRKPSPSKMRPADPVA